MDDPSLKDIFSLDSVIKSEDLFRSRPLKRAFFTLPKPWVSVEYFPWVDEIYMYFFLKWPIFHKKIDQFCTILTWK